MASIGRACVLLTSGVMVMGAYECPGGWTAKSGTPTCPGTTSSACTHQACCNMEPTAAPTPAPTHAKTCSDYSVAWVLSQALGSGCKTDNKFFDLKNLANAVASPQADADVKAACCTPFADATCSDWNLMACPSSKTKVMTNSAPGGNDMELSQSDFEDHCCVPTPAPTYTCASFSVTWAAAQLVGNGCKTDSKFFDMKKLDVTVTSDGDADIKAACCTLLSDAMCSDWFMACPSGKYVKGNTAAPGEGDDMSMTTSSFQSTCCGDPLKCADYVADEQISSAARVAASTVGIIMAVLTVM